MSELDIKYHLVCKVCGNRVKSNAEAATHLLEHDLSAYFDLVAKVPNPKGNSE